MTKWEYLVVVGVNSKVVSINGKLASDFKVPFIGDPQGRNVFEYINLLGQEGWELVGYTNYGGTSTSAAYCFKRSLL